MSLKAAEKGSLELGDCRKRPGGVAPIRGLERKESWEELEKSIHSKAQHRVEPRDEDSRRKNFSGTQGRGFSEEELQWKNSDCLLCERWNSWGEDMPQSRIGASSGV
jgi:hypothetical protein